MKKLLATIFLFIIIFQPLNAKTNFDEFVNAINNSRKLKLTIDFENTAKQFGYKNFEQFVDEYKIKYDLEDLTVDEAKEFLIGADRSVEIVESEENFKKLHSLIINNKYFKKNAYFKKKRYDNAKVLAVYLDYEKEMSKITQNSNLDKISRFAWHWIWHTKPGRELYHAQKFDAIAGCRENRIKRGVPDGGRCILVESRYRDEFKILINKETTKRPILILKSSSNIFEELDQLNELYKSGTLTKDEFEKAKKKLLNK